MIKTVQSLGLPAAALVALLLAMARPQIGSRPVPTSRGEGKAAAVEERLSSARSLRDRVLSGEDVAREIQLGKSGKGVEWRAAAVEDAHPRWRAFALKVLADRRDPSLESFFHERLLRDPDYLPRYTAAIGLEKLESLALETWDSLRHAVLGETHPKVQQQIRKLLRVHRPRIG